MKKTKILLTTWMIIVVVGIGFGCINYIKYNNKVNFYTDIEYNKPMIRNTANPGGEKLQYVCNTEEILERYNHIDRNYLTYNPSKKDNKEYYFIKENGPKPGKGMLRPVPKKGFRHKEAIDDKDYKAILNGYSYHDEKRTLVKQDALRKMRSLIPADATRIKEDIYENAELIYYESSEGNLVINMEFERHHHNPRQNPKHSKEEEEEEDHSEFNKNRITTLNYYKEVEYKN